MLESLRLGIILRIALHRESFTGLLIAAALQCVCYSKNDGDLLGFVLAASSNSASTLYTSQNYPLLHCGPWSNMLTPLWGYWDT